MLLMNENRTIYLASIYLFCATLFWAGNFIIGKTEPKSKIIIGKKEVNSKKRIYFKKFWNFYNFRNDSSKYF